MNDRDEVVWCAQVIRLRNVLFLSLHLTHTQAESERSVVSLRSLACFCRRGNMKHSEAVVGGGLHRHACVTLHPPPPRPPPNMLLRSD